MEIIVSVWKKPNPAGDCDIEKITITEDEIEQLAVDKYKEQFGHGSLYHWQIEHIVP